MSGFHSQADLIDPWMGLVHGTFKTPQGVPMCSQAGAVLATASLSQGGLAFSLLKGYAVI